MPEADRSAQPGDEEIWDFKATQVQHPLPDRLRPAGASRTPALYRERTGRLPRRCVIYFVNEPDEVKGLLAVPVDDDIVDAAVEWTVGQVEDLRATTLEFESDPLSVEGGSALLRRQPVGDRVDDDLQRPVHRLRSAIRLRRVQSPTSARGSGKPKRDVDPLAVGRN